MIENSPGHPFVQFVDLETGRNVAIPTADIALLEESYWQDDMSRRHLTTVITLRGQERKLRLGWPITQLLTLLAGGVPPAKVDRDDDGSDDFSDMPEN